jgi:hypothetical protein
MRSILDRRGAIRMPMDAYAMPLRGEQESDEFADELVREMDSVRLAALES